MRINKLLEEKSFLQNEVYKYKEHFQQQRKEIDDMDQIITNLEKEKNREIKNYSNRGINSAGIKYSSNSQKNIKNNDEIININFGVNNKQNFKTIDKSTNKRINKANK